MATHLTQSLSWLDQSDSRAPLAPATVNFATAQTWDFLLPSIFHNTPTFPCGVAINNGGNSFTVILTAGPLSVTINPFDARNIPLPEKTESVSITSNVVAGTVGVTFYVVPPPDAGVNFLAVQQAAAAAVASLALGTMNPIINSEFKVWPDANIINGTGAAVYGPEGWQLVGAAVASTVSRQAGIINSEFCARVQRTVGSVDINPVFFATQLQSSDSFFPLGSQITLAFDIAFGANFSAAGGTLTVSVIGGIGVDQNVLAGFTGALVLATGNIAVASSGSRVTITSAAAVPANITQLGIVATYVPVGVAGAADSFSLGRMQFDTGATAQSFRPVPEAIERDRCETFYEVLNPNLSNAIMGIGFNFAANTVKCGMKFKRKRIVPTVTPAAPGNFQSDDAAGSRPLNAIAASVINFESALMTGTTTAGVVVGQGCTLSANTAFGSIAINARM